MRESTPASTEANDTVTAITRYNYWFPVKTLDTEAYEPGTPLSTCNAYGSAGPKDQLLGEQRFELAHGSTPLTITGTYYVYASVDGSWHKNSLTEKRSRTAQASASTWPTLERQDTNYGYEKFMFLSSMNMHRERLDGNCVVERGASQDTYEYDIFGRLLWRRHNDCADSCTPTDGCSPCDSGSLSCSSAGLPEVLGEWVIYGYDGASPRVLDERGPLWKGQLGDPVPVWDWIHATYTFGALGQAFRFDRSGQIADEVEHRIEPLMDGTFNNVAAAKLVSSTVTTSFQQTDAYGRLINPEGAVADLGSFGWRGREGTISFRFLTEAAANDPQIFRMGDRPYDAPTGRFTQSDRLVLAGMSPLAANRYIYALSDPVNQTDPEGAYSYAEIGCAMAAIGTLLAIIGSQVKNAGIERANPNMIRAGYAIETTGVIMAGVGLFLISGLLGAAELSTADALFYSSLLGGGSALAGLIVGDERARWRYGGGSTRCRLE
jgi:RHS repeat-associated protein